MDLASLDITLGRIRQIESRIGQIDQRISQLSGEEYTAAKSFDSVLNKKLEEVRKPSESEKTGNKDKNDLKNLIEKYSKENGLDTSLINAVIQTESAFNNDAVSHAGAQGLMQLMPFTADRLGVDDPFDPEQNISGGTKYLKNMINRYGSVELGLAAYNAGPESVDKYGGIPPFNETQNYVKKVLNLQKNL